MLDIQLPEISKHSKKHKKLKTKLNLSQDSAYIKHIDGCII